MNRLLLLSLLFYFGYNLCIFEYPLGRNLKFIHNSKYECNENCCRKKCLKSLPKRLPSKKTGYICTHSGSTIGGGNEYCCRRLCKENKAAFKKDSASTFNCIEYDDLGNGYKFCCEKGCSHDKLYPLRRKTKSSAYACFRGHDLTGGYKYCCRKKCIGEYSIKKEKNTGGCIKTKYLGGTDKYCCLGKDKTIKYKLKDWYKSLDRKGWSTCGSGYFLKSIYRNTCNHLYCLEGAVCSKPKYNTISNTRCKYIKNWFSKSTQGWRDCSNGYFLHGFYNKKNWGKNLNDLLYTKCCKPKDIIGYGQCYKEYVGKTFKKKGWIGCKPGYYLTGFYQLQNCYKLSCIYNIKCCKMKW